MRLPGPGSRLGRRISGTAMTHCVMWRRPASPARRIPERDHTSRARSVTGAVRRRGRNTTDRLELALAALWLLDGGLQLQPAMFTRRFATHVILPAGYGEPAVVAGPIHLAGQLILVAPAAFNALFAVTQLAIGVGIVVRRTSRLALAASAVWSLTVWVMGEGLGGLAAPGAMLLTGAPGAALIYGVLSVAALPGHDRPGRWLRPVWALLWVGGAALQILAGPQAAARAVSANAQAAPGLLRSVDTAALSVLPRSGELALAGLVGVQVLVAFAPLVTGRTRAIAVALAVVTPLAFWVLGQSLGAFWTGVATDPNAGPAFALLAVAALVGEHPARRSEWWWRREVWSGVARAARDREPFARRPGQTWRAEQVASSRRT